MRLHGRIERHQHASRLLQGNPLGDPDGRELLIYLPPDYSLNSRYPVVMLLGGYGSSGQNFANYSFFEPNTVQRFDRLVASGRSKPAILVMPDAMTRWGGSQFIDSEATGRYQSYLADEVVPFVDAHYRSAPVREARAIVGRSSGGFGALRMGLDRPEVFGALGSHAGDSAFEISILPELREAAIGFDRAGGLAPFIENFTEEPSSVPFTALMILAYSTAYTPDLEVPLPHCQLPFEISTGELRPDVWRRFLEHDPLERLRREPQALCDHRCIFLDAGDRDEHGLHFGTRMMGALLKERGAKLVMEEFPGGHRGTGHRYERSLPILVDACQAAL
ncbi:MAG: esterase family protein [Myxococcales bacterium]|nr:esterase family protein [Myxococcales bacterium]